tara:strand:- start:4908 stop:5090 length:183 start_codon:yes stop_codon:yes gene_type:complete
MSEEKTKFGYACPCKRWHEADAYSLAHTQIELRHTCGDCGRVNTILDFEIVNTIRPKEKP